MNSGIIRWQHCMHVLPVDSGAETAAAAGDREAVPAVHAVPAAADGADGAARARGEPRRRVGGGHEAVPGAAAEAEVPAEAAGAVRLVPEVVLQGKQRNSNFGRGI